MNVGLNGTTFCMTHLSGKVLFEGYLFEKSTLFEQY